MVLVGSACSEDPDPASLILGERVLAIRAEPPEAVPGETVRLTPLVVSPEGTLTEGVDFSATWWRCPDNEATALADEERCAAADTRTTLGGGVPLAHEIDPALFDPAPDAEADDTGAPDEQLLGAALGYWRVLGLTMDAGGQREEAIKRVVVFGSRRPLGEVDERFANLDIRAGAGGAVEENINPQLQGVEVRTGGPDGDVVTELTPGADYWLRPRYDASQLQAYWAMKMDLEGLTLTDPLSLREMDEAELLARFERVRRCELPVFSWYVTAGKLRDETSVDESVRESVFGARDVICPTLTDEPRRPDVRFTAPEGDDVPDDGLVHAWVVLRDGRGGTDFRAFDLSVAQ